MNLNKYGKLSGGYIFDIMDRFAHGVACDLIGECVTGNANINFMNPANPDDDIKLSRNIYPIQENKVDIVVHAECEGKTIAIASFLFIAKK